jgi:NAD(P)-dependent dehydrogenase (short-subunit alcohol dehydrogenase family)
MRAACIYAYGGPEVLLRVHAAEINPIDWKSAFFGIHVLHRLPPLLNLSPLGQRYKARFASTRRTHMSLFAMFKSAGPTGFGYGSTAEQVTEGLSLVGQTILVTGCNSGVGQEACRVLALRGALVLGTARTKEKAAAACATFPGKAIGYACELSNPSSVRECVAAVKADGHRLDAIICNAGIMMLPKLEKSHGYELQFFTNHIGHFMLVTGLLEQLKDEGRIVMLSSSGHRQAPASGIEFDNLSGDKGYKPMAAYGQSKMANLLFAKELQRRFAGTRKTAYAVHPGVVDTNLARNVGPVLRRVFAVVGHLFFKSVGVGAATEVFAAVSPKAVPLAGNYLADSNVKKPRADAEDAALATRLWAESEKIVQAL